MSMTATRDTYGPRRGLAEATAFTPALFLPLLIVYPSDLAIFIFDLKFTPLRLFLLAFAAPSIMLLLQRRLHWGDWLFLGYAVWVTLMRAKNMTVVSSGIFFIEAVLIYLFAVAYIRSVQQVIALLKVYFALICVLGVLAATISISGEHFVLNAIERITGVRSPFQEEIYRLGLLRTGIVTHPIIYGIFCASVLGMLWYARSSLANGMTRLIVVPTAVFFSLSSGPLLTVGIQLGLIMLEHFSRWLKNRAAIITSGCVAVLGFLEWYGAKGVFGIVAAYLTLNSNTAWYRLWIWEQVTGDISRHPIFGMNPNNWSRLRGMSDSIDAQWLLTPLQAGLPSIALLLLSLLVMIRLLFLRPDAEIDPRLAGIRRGWTFAMIGPSGMSATAWRMMRTDCRSS